MVDDDLSFFPDKQSELEYLEFLQEGLTRDIEVLGASMPAAAPAPVGRNGLPQSMMHPAALTHPANPLFTRPEALMSPTALTGVDDRRMEDLDREKEGPTMPLADLLREVGAGVANQVIDAGERLVTETSSMVVQEAGRAAEQVSQLADLRLRSAESFMRDVPAVDRISAEPMGPATPSQTPALDQVVQEAAATPPQEMEHDLER